VTIEMMSEKLVFAIISGLFFPMLLEVWKDRRKRIAASVGSPHPAGGTFWRVLRISARLILSAAFGFFFAAGAAVFLTQRGHPDIEFGSDLCLIFIVLFSIISWSLLSSVGPLKSRRS
jgi:Trk-type K+ transport system membrane component